jgi:DNA-binding NarL/FixJ family response regulator
MPKFRLDESNLSLISVWLVEPHPLAASLLKNLLLAERRFTLLSDAQLSNDLDRRKATAIPCVVVIDGEVLGGCLHGFVSSLRERLPEGKILIVGPAMENAELCRLMMLGIRGFVPYENVAELLCRAVSAIWQGSLWITPLVLESFVAYAASLAERKKGSTAITPRERLILNSLAKNLSNKEIALELKISERTVKFHLENLFSKLGVHDRHSVIKITHSRYIEALLKSTDLVAGTKPAARAPGWQSAKIPFLHLGL